MAANILSLVTLALGLVLVAQLTSGAPQCSRIKAGFYRRDRIHLIIGDQWLTVGTQFDFESKKPVSDLHFGREITAAVSLNELYERFFLYSGTAVQAFSDYGKQLHYEFVGGSELDAAFANEANFKGIDAAINLDGTVHFLAGCSYVKSRGYPKLAPKSASPISDLNLPCNVDAAFYLPLIRRSIVVKGDQAWLFSGGRFYGPTRLNSLIPALKQVNLCAA